MAVTIKLCLMASAGGRWPGRGEVWLEKQMQNWEKKHISVRIEGFRQCEACVSEEEARRGGSVWRSSGGLGGGAGEGQRQAGREAKLFLFSPTQATSCGASQGKLINRFGLFIYIYI